MLIVGMQLGFIVGRVLGNGLLSDTSSEPVLRARNIILNNAILCSRHFLSYCPNTSIK